MTFKDGAASLGTGTLSSGQATFSTTLLSVSSHSITAVYGGDTNFATSTSSGIIQTVNKGDTTTAISTSPNPSIANQSVTLTATVSVTSPASGTPTGNVAFKDGGTTIGSGTLSNGQAKLTTTTLPVGTRNITAVYQGDDSFNASTSSGHTQTVNTGETSTIISSAPNPSAVGQPAIITVRVKGFGGGAPTGTIQLKDGENNLGSPVELFIDGIGSIAAGSAHTCAVLSSTGLQCWGLGSSGQRGDGTTTSVDIPIDVSSLSSGVLSASLGGEHSCVLKNSGGVACWGKNDHGQVGDGGSIDQLVPTDVSGLVSGINSVVAGFAHNCVLTAQATVKCWGWNNKGQLGDGTTDDRSTPTEIAGLSSIKAIAAGVYHTCVLTNAGGVKCWGGNELGAVGDGTTTDRLAPVDVIGLTSNVIALATSGQHTMCALLTGGAVKCWGYNGFGQVGDGTTINRSIPTDVTGLSSEIVAVAAGTYHTCAISGSGALKCWGWNQYGQVGDDSTNDRSTPVDVTRMTSGVSAIAVGGEFTCAIVDSGTVRCWGRNQFGQLGLGDSGTRNTPTDVEGLTSLAYSKAVISTASLGAGSHTLTAEYGGDAGHNANTSDGYTHRVQAPSTTTLLASSNSSVYGQLITFTATVAADSGMPSGSVTFKDSATTLGTGTLSSGQATLSTSALAVGAHFITVAYEGDGTFLSSTSGSLTQNVNKGTTTLTATAAPAMVQPNQQVTLKGMIQVTAPASATPGGTVTFKEGVSTIGQGNVSAGVGQFTLTTSSIGRRIITAKYSGDGNLNSSSNTTIFTVSAALNAEGRGNTFTTGAQQFPAIAKLKSGYFVTWASNGQDGAGYGVYGQRYTEAGAKLGRELRISTATAGNQSVPKVVGLKAGGFIVTWQSDGQDGSGGGIYAQNFNATGGKVGAEFRVNSTTVGAQTGPAIAALSGGGFVIAWTTNGQDKSGLGVYAQRYDAKAKAAGSEFKVNTVTMGAQSMPTIAALANGGFVIAWQSDGQDHSGLGVFGHRYDSAGRALGAEFAINRTTAGPQSLPSAAGLSDGGFVVAFQGPDSSGLGIYSRRFNASGVASGNDVLVNTMTAQHQSQPNVAAFSDGGYVVLWSSMRQDGSGKGVYAQAYKANGAKANIEFLVNTITAKDQWQPAAAGGTAGTFMGAWTSRDQDGSLEGVYTARFQVPMN